MIINQVKLKAVSIVSFPDQLFHSRWITSPLRRSGDVSIRDSGSGYETIVSFQPF